MADAPNSKKVFDVAKPGKAPPSATSRPVIVGHGAMIKDPMVSSSDTTKDSTPTPGTAPAVTADLSNFSISRKKIIPLSEQADAPAPLKGKEKKAKTAPVSSVKILDEPLPAIKPAEEQPDTEESSTLSEEALPTTESAEPKTSTTGPSLEAEEPNSSKIAISVENTSKSEEPKTEELSVTKTDVVPSESIPPAPDPTEDKDVADVVAASEKTPSTEVTNDSTAPAPTADSSSAAAVNTLAGVAETKKEEDKKAKEEADRQEAIEKLIASKKYYLPLGETRRKRSSRFASFVLVLMLLAAGGVYVAVDMGAIDPGFDLPYEFISD